MVNMFSLLRIIITQYKAKVGLFSCKKIMYKEKELDLMKCLDWCTSTVVMFGSLVVKLKVALGLKWERQHYFNKIILINSIIIY